MLELRPQSSGIFARSNKLRLDLRDEMARVAGMAKASKSLSGRRTKIFADLTACLEDAHEHSVVGQNSRLQDAGVIAAIDAINSFLERAQRLLQSARDISK